MTTSVERLLVFLLVTRGVVGCGVDVVGGQAIDKSNTEVTDAGVFGPVLADDGSVNADAATSVVDASDALSDALGDACSPPYVLVEDTFATGISSAVWRVSGSSVYTIAGGSNGSYVTLAPTLSVNDAAGALWSTSPKRIESMVVSFLFRIDLPAAATNGGGEGLTFAWFDATSIADAANAPPSEVGGGAMGLPNATKGFAFAVDVAQTSNAADPSAPYFGLLALNETKTPGEYDWHVASQTSSQATSLYGVWHSVKLTLAAGMVSVVLDGSPLFTNVSGFSSMDSAIAGFTAATHAVSGMSFAIDEVRIALGNPNGGCGLLP